MKKVEFRKFNAGSVFKAVIYLMVIPMVLVAFIGIIAAIVGAATGSRTAIMVGVIYLFMPVVLIFVYGGLSALASLIYNLFAKKFGGLEVYVEETVAINDSEDNQPSYEVKNSEDNKE